MKIKLYLTLLILLPLAACSADPAGAPRGGARRPAHNGPPGGRTPGASQGLRPVTVRAAQATRAPISTYILSNTTLEAIRQVTVYSKLNAIVSKILVEEGSAVAQGEVMIHLEDQEIRNEYNQARIAVDQARLALEQAKVKARRSKASYERAHSLFEQKLISREDFDQTVLVSRTDDLARDAAREQLRAAQARLEAAKIQLDYTEIRSPIRGVVLERRVDVGDRLNVNQAVFEVADFSRMWARIFVPEKELARVRVGQRARVRFDAFPGHDYQATVKMVNPAVDVDSGTVKVTLELHDRSRRLRPGMFGTVYIATETRPSALVIPKRAILRERDDTRVFVVKADNTVEKRSVKLGFSDENRVEILSGVREGEAVVTVGGEGLNDGYPVEVVAGPPEAGRTPPQVAAQTRPKEVEGTGPARNSRGVGAGGAVGAERAKRFRQRLLGNPEIRKAYQARLKQDPTLATDPRKQRQFFREMMRRLRRQRQR